GPECVAQARAIRPQLPELRTVMTTEGGAPEWQDYAACRDAQSADDPKAEIRRQDIAIQLYTSGTTGRPKGAMLSRQPYQPHGDRRGRKAGMEKVDGGRSIASGDGGRPYRRHWLGIARPLFRRQRRGRAGIRSHQGARLHRALQDHEIVHGAGRDAVRGAATASAAGRLLAPEIHALWRLAYSRRTPERMHRGVRLRLCAALWLDGNPRRHRGAAAVSPCRGVGSDALGGQGTAGCRACDPRS